MLILIAGPSGSGKTTLSKKLAKVYDAELISMDDFFYTVTERDELGFGKNWDHPKMLNWKLFNQVMTDILNNKEVMMPQYSKKTGMREFKKFKLTKKNLIIEGIWALSKKNKLNADLKLFVNARESVRKQRKLHRDSTQYNRSKEEILLNWNKYVVPMEKLHVIPTKENADFVIDECDDECFLRATKKLSAFFKNIDFKI